MNSLPAYLFNDAQLQRHADINGLVILDMPGRRSVATLLSWGREKARVRFPSQAIRSIPRGDVHTIIDPVEVRA